MAKYDEHAPDVAGRVRLATARGMPFDRHHCEQCPATYTTAVNLRAHVAAKHPVDPGISVMVTMVGRDGSEWLAAGVIGRPKLMDNEKPEMFLDEEGIRREGLHISNIQVVTPSPPTPPQG